MIGLTAATRAWASAWNQPAGHGLFVMDYTFTGGSRYFNGAGTLSPAAAYAKSEGIGYLEYGLTDNLMAIVQPALQRISIAPASAVAGQGAARYAGLGTSEAALQLHALAFGPAVLALQTGFRLPGSRDDTKPALVGDTSRDLDLRALGGYSFAVGGWQAFVDAQASFRLRSGGAPPEWHTDVTLGVRPTPRLLLLLQSITTGSIGSGTAWYPASRWSKLSGSIVYDLTPRWSVELGVFETVAGTSALREQGEKAALWYRF